MSVRVYYRIVLETMSALSIGTAVSDVTDNDVMLDSRGIPLIPATSLAGVYRSFFWNPHGEVKLNEHGNVVEDHREDVCKRIFGSLGNEGQSSLRVYDASLLKRPENYQGDALFNEAVSIRDGVKLKDDQKVADPKKKFDRQIVEAGALFETFLEVVDEKRCSASEVEELLQALNAGELTLGSKTTRGFGKVRIVECVRRRFDMGEESDRESWLAFNMFDAEDERWSDEKSERLDSCCLPKGKYCGPDELVIRLGLRLRGGIAIREYVGEAAGNDTERKLDYQQLSVRIVEDGKETGTEEPTPVIPGTSWAGAIRSRYRIFDTKGTMETELFGNVNELTNEAFRSSIVIGESILEKGVWKKITRNAIDPFTGGTIEGALYTEKSYWGGVTSLELRIKGLDSLSARAKSLEPLVISLVDLHNGFLAVGGLTAVGRGLLEIMPDDSYVLVRETHNDVSEKFFESIGLERGMEERTLIEAVDVTEVASLLYGSGTGSEVGQ